MMRATATIALLLSLQGCALLDWWRNPEPPISVSKKLEERAKLNLLDPKPIKPSGYNWILITPKNADKVWAELKSKNVDLVLFALTDDDYEELAIDMAQIRSFIQQQRDIIIKYRDYYEPAKPSAKEEGK